MSKCTNAKCEAYDSDWGCCSQGHDCENHKEDKKVAKDMVHHPDHYCYSEYEPKDVIRAWGLNFNLGSAVKYIARCGRKDDILQELRKAREFLTFEIDAIIKEREQRKEDI